MPIIILALTALGLLLVAGLMQRRVGWLRRLSANLLISYIVIVAILGAGELYFRYAYADSEGLLASQNWQARYWQTNTLGFRDRAWTAADWAGKTTLMVTGDSFAAGWGVNDPADRFSDVLAARLGSAYAVLNLGIFGTSTPEQRDLLVEHPLDDPDVVIMQYFLNDIEYAGLTIGLTQDFQHPPPLVQDTYLGSFLYSRLFPWGPGENYYQWLYDAYDNYVIWDIHRAEIEAYIDTVEAMDARLIAVIFPNMLDPFGSIAYVDRVAQVFEGRGHTEILKLFDAVAAWPLLERIVSPRDSHPSAAFHRYVGETLHELYFSIR